MTKRILSLCALAGPATVVIALIGWLVAGVLPIPLGPESSVQQVVDFYGQTRVLVGMSIASLGICLVFPLVAVIGVHMVRMEGRTPILTFLQLITGAATGVLLLLPMLLMAVIGFRPDRNPELTVTLNDIAWLLFITPIAPFIIQNVAIGIAILNDKRRTLPRWVAFVNFWVAFSFLPDPLAFFFHSGPFAWRGIFIFWLALTTYTIFLVVMGVMLHQAVEESADDDASSSSVATR
ncbi:hypothetical protein [Mycolicibacterium sp. 050158]|uniref:hypothetical protein n=1 Tax=Mycolicibacterium sp. 050158 TaxID=3090602 RepID=UPI00299E539D|nr:hypothetical protein [Mycolicibacterium sp. 050158]MDX1888926.1 hypothetical protein [Mycolicibacterium sp. 050158]